MPSIRRLPLLVCALLIALLFTHVAHAQTIANGPYYAVPSWDQTLPAATRFVVLSNFGGKAVLDRETGLVWERAPGTNSPGSPLQAWEVAFDQCQRMSIGERMGWRLPTIAELRSLVAENQILPVGHPFQGIDDSSTGIYWSSIRSPHSSDFAFVHGLLNGAAGMQGMSIPGRYICVRGGGGA